MQKKNVYFFSNKEAGSKPDFQELCVAGEKKEKV